jgi:hypothetical protein
VKTALLLVLLQLGTNGADAYFTNRNMNTRHFSEYDPLARPFTRSAAVLSISQSFGVGGSLYSESWLRSHHHKRWADALTAVQIAGHSCGAVVSAKGYKP